MSCCSGGCSCGKSDQTPVQEQVYLAQLKTNDGMLSTHDWMIGLNNLKVDEEIIEVRFKNNRKEFFRNGRLLRLEKDDRIVVDIEGGHDVGIVSLTGDLAGKQFANKSRNQDKNTLKQVYRIANEADVEKWLEARKKDRPALVKCRELASSLGLEMSIGDVEFRGDVKKLTVYYTADGRVDFRELLKFYMNEFKMKIEMRQIGARQNAARTGGIGSCGRELCCSTWKTEMNSVKTDAARTQDLSLNASRLAGQCGKLKCCLNYELETYLEAWESFPAELINLETDRGILRPLNADVLKGEVQYSFEEPKLTTRYVLSIDQVKEYIMLNKKGKLVETGQIQVS
ncbi:MAG: regulatory iron-sulfur-containing complex subunit RicT [Bacteroidales bacterium]